MTSRILILGMAALTAVCAIGACAFIYNPYAISLGATWRWTEEEPPRQYARDALATLYWQSPEAFAAVNSHPAVEDGITEDEYRAIALVADAGINNPDKIEALLDPSQRQMEEREITLPLRGDIELVIVRFGDGAAQTMDKLERAVRFTEEYMDEQFPARLVLLLVADMFGGDYVGHNTHINMALHPDYDSGDGWKSDFTESILVHEVAHYYWHSSAELWLDEGAAEIMAIIQEESHSGYMVSDSDLTLPCSVPNLRSLEELPGQLPEDCVYSLGPRLFLDLYRTLGAADFRVGFQTLFRLGQGAVLDVDARSIDDLRLAFGFVNAEKADQVVQKWYAGR